MTILWVSSIITLLIESINSQYDIGQILQNDKYWIEPYSAFQIFKDSQGQDFFPTNTAAVPTGTHNEVVSFKLIDSPDCTFHRLLSVDNTSEKFIYVSLCSTTMLVFDVDLRNETSLKFKITLPTLIATSDVCMDAVYWDLKIALVFKSSPDLPNNIKLIIVSTIDSQVTTAGPLTITDSSKYLLSARFLLGNYTVSGQLKHFLVLYDAPVPTDFKQANVNTPKQNYYLYFFDSSSITSPAVVKALPVPNPHKLLTISSFGDKFYIGHYSSQQKKGKISVCTVQADLVLGCLELTTGFDLSAGTLIFTRSPTSSFGLMYFVELTKSLLGVCRVNFQQALGFIADSNCVYSSSFGGASSDIEFTGFESASSEGAVALYRQISTNLFAAVDFLASQPVNAVYARRRVAAKFYAGWGRVALVGSGNRVQVLDQTSTPGLALTNTNTAGSISQEVNMLLLANNATSKIQVTARVAALVEAPVVNTLADPLQGSVGYFLRLPVSQDSLKGNQLDVSAVTGLADTVTLHINNLVYTLDATQSIDRAILVGDSLIGIQNNLTNKTLLKYFNCARSLNQIISYACEFFAETEINGVPRSQMIFDQGVANGSIDKNLPFVYVQDSIVKISNFKQKLFVVTKDNTTEANLVLILFTKSSKSSPTKFNFSKEVKQIDLVSYRNDLYVSGVDKLEKQVQVWQITDFNLGNIKLLRTYSSILEPGDLCVKSSGIYIKHTPRIRYISQCSIGSKEFFIEREILPASTKTVQSLYSNLAQFGPSISQEIRGCLLGNYYVFWETNTPRIHGLAGYKPDTMRVDLTGYGFTQFSSFSCLSNSQYLVLTGEAGGDFHIFLIAAKPDRRNPIYLKVASPVTELIVSEGFTREIFVGFKNSSGYQNLRIDTSGPLVYVRSNTVSTSTRTSITAKNALSTTIADQLSAFSVVEHSTRVNALAKQSITNKEFDLEEMHSITGPVFTVTNTGFDSSKVQIYPRFYLNDTVQGGSAYSKYKIKFQVGARLEYSTTSSSLLVYKDPQTLRTKINLDYFANDQLAITSDTTNSFAYTVIEGYNTSNLYIFVHKTSLSPIVTTYAKGAIPVESESTSLTINQITSTGILDTFVVDRFNKNSKVLVSAVFSFATLSTGADWTTLSPMISNRLSRGRFVSSSPLLQPHHPRRVLRGHLR